MVKIVSSSLFYLGNIYFLIVNFVIGFINMEMYYLKNWSFFPTFFGGMILKHNFRLLLYYKLRTDIARLPW